MADRNGYIGRAPGDSSVTVARQVFSPTGVQTDFTFASGYVPGYLDVYLNGAKLIVAQDFTATDGSVVGLTSFAQSGDVVEAVAFKAFNAAAVTQAADFTVTGNQTNDGTLSVTGGTTLSNLIVTGITTLSAGSSVSFATTAFDLGAGTNLNIGIVTVTTLSGGEVNGSDANFTGILTAASASFSGNVSVGGTLTYEDVTNIDSVGIVTARTGVRITEGGLVITAGVSTFSGPISVGDTISLGDHDKLRFGDGNDLQIFHNGTVSRVDNNVGALQIRNLLDDSDISLQTDNGSGGVAEYVLCDGSTGAVELKHYGNKKLETTNTGAVVTGILTATSFEGSGENLTNLPASGDANDITASLFT